MFDAIRAAKIATGGIHSGENYLALSIEEENARSNFMMANLFHDFKEFLMDVYMAPGEFEECWDQFEKWEENEQPTTQNINKNK